MSSTNIPQSHEIHFPLRENTYNIIKELAEHHGMGEPECLIIEYILSGLESHLTGQTTTTLNISEELGAYIAKRHDFNPTDWREGGESIE